MKKVGLLSFLFLISQIIIGLDEQDQNLDLYSNEFKSMKSLFSSCVNLSDPLKTNPIKQEPPDYPRRALELGISGTTLLKIRVKKDGTVKNTEIVWSSADNPKYKTIFDRSSIRSGNKFVYEPKVNSIGENIEFTAYTISKFYIEGTEETLYLGSQNRKFNKLKKMMSKDPNKFLNEVEILLSTNELEPLQRAIYLFFKGLTLYQQGEDRQKIISILEKSQKLYYKIFIYKTDNDEDKTLYLMGNNESKLHTYVGVLLGQLYLEKAMWNEASIQFSSVLRNMKNNKKSKSTRYLQSYISLGISTYNLKLWCQADESWNNAITMAKSLNTKFPDYLINFKEEANKRRGQNSEQ